MESRCHKHWISFPNQQRRYKDDIEQNGKPRAASDRVQQCLGQNSQQENLDKYF